MGVLGPENWLWEILDVDACVKSGVYCAVSVTTEGEASLCVSGTMVVVVVASSVLRSVAANQNT